MKTAISIAICSLGIYTSLSAQSHLVKLTDKGVELKASYACETLVGPEAVKRRSIQGIPCTYTDLPIQAAYIEAIQAKGGTIVQFSKWLNTLQVEGLTTEQLQEFAFVAATRPIAIFKQPSFKSALASTSESSEVSDLFVELKETGLPYGYSVVQLEMLNTQFLHDQNFLGQDMIIAVMDGGFRGVDTAAAFANVRNGHLIGAFDFANPDSLKNPYTNSNHGTQVLSCMSAAVPDVAYGGAPEASYILYKTEVIASESRAEELNWARAAEHADSLGAMVFNTSLGYTEFDDTTTSYTKEDLDGNTALITRAADLAASKGILVVNSAGNSGSDPWKYIGVPADGDSVLAIGAVDSDRILAGFSSRGDESFAAGIKPNVMAQGQQTVVISSNGQVRVSNGTSFSGPVMAGVATALWQAFPNASNMDVFQAIQRSADRYQTPDYDYGYGIPDMQKAFSYLNTLFQEDLTSVRFEIYPNPVSNVLQFNLNSDLKIDIQYRILDLTGRTVQTGELLKSNSGTQSRQIPMTEAVSSGTYIIELQTSKYKTAQSFIKL